MRDAGTLAGGDLVMARVTAGAVGLGLLGSLGSAILELQRSNATEAILALCIALGFGGLLVAFRLSGNRRLVGNGVVLLLVLHSAVLITTSGGAHPSIVVAPAVPVVSVLLCGLRAGVAWSLGTVGALVAGGLGAFHAPLASLGPEAEALGRARMQGAAILTLAMLGVAALYEHLRGRARREAELARAEREAARADLERSHERFRALVERTFDGFTILDPAGSLEYLNPAAGGAIGYRSDAIAGITVSDCTTRFVHPDDCERVREAYRACRETTGATLTLEARYRHRDGGWRNYELHAKNMIDDAAVGGVVVNYRDITDRRRAEEERRQTTERMGRVRKLESLVGLAAGIAHDFNNLFTIAQGNASLVRRVLPEGSPSLPLIREIEDAIQRGTELTDQLLTFSSAKPMQMELLALGRVVGSQAQVLSASAPPSADVAFDARPGLPLVTADRERIQELVARLFENAWESLEGPGTVRVSTGSTEVDAVYLEQCHDGPAEFPEGRCVYLEVSDSGSGVPSEELARMFEPFYSTKFQGRGLGLSAALGIARSCRGVIHVESELGRGTAVRVLFPIANSGNAGADPPQGSAKHVLLVDDEEGVRRVGERILATLGIHTRTAASGPEALAELEQGPGRFGLVLLDLTMPGISGAELIPHIRRLDPEVPIVLMSGYRGAEAPIADDSVPFLQKPFTLERLAAVVEAVGLRPSESD